MPLTYNLRAPGTPCCIRALPLYCGPLQGWTVFVALLVGSIMSSYSSSSSWGRRSDDSQNMVLRSFSSCRKRNKSNSDDEDQDKVPRQNSDVATTSSKIKRAKTLDNDDTNPSKVITSLKPPPNAMKDAVHTSQYGDKFPPEVRPLLEEWKKQYLNVKNGKSLDAAYEDTLTTDAESQCEIVGCEYIRTYHRYCALHYSLAESVQRLVLGLYCSNTGCINKAAFAKRYDGKDLCTSCKSRSKHDDEDDTLEGTEEEIRKHAREMGLPKVIQRYNELQLMYPDATITLYTGQSIDTDRRFKQHDYTPITKDYVDALKVKQVSSIYEANPYEHELIKASAEHFGREYIINRMPGGGFGQANMNLKSTIYVLFYTRHKLRIHNKIDYSEEPTVPEGVKIRKLPKIPQLPKMPLFWNRISYMTAIKMLGYNVIPLEELNRNNHHPCPYEGCSEVFADIEDYRKHYRTMHIMKDDPEATLNEMSTYDEQDNSETQDLEPSERHLCPVANCGKSFMWKGDLDKHVRRDHPETLNLEPLEKHLCPIANCGKSFKEKKNLNAHVKLKHPEILGLEPPERHECSVAGCGKSYARKPDLKKHIVSTHPEILDLESSEKHECPITGCDKKYQEKKGLNKHIRQQHPETLGLEPHKRHECSINGCDKSYKAKSDLNKHIKQHHPETLGIEPPEGFICSVSGCGKRVKYKSNLVAHERTHMKDI